MSRGGGQSTDYDWLETFRQGHRICFNDIRAWVAPFSFRPLDFERERGLVCGRTHSHSHSNSELQTTCSDSQGQAPSLVSSVRFPPERTLSSARPHAYSIILHTPSHTVAPCSPYRLTKHPSLHHAPTQPPPPAQTASLLLASNRSTTTTKTKTKNQDALNNARISTQHIHHHTPSAGWTSRPHPVTYLPSQPPSAGRVRNAVGPAGTDSRWCIAGSPRWAARHAARDASRCV